MKGTKIWLVLAAGLLACGMMRECRDDAVREEERLLLVDTLVYVDTVRYYMPMVKDSTVIHYVTMRLPVAEKGERPPGDKPADAEGSAEKPADAEGSAEKPAGAGGSADGPLAEARGPDKKAGAEEPGMPGDSVDVELPIVMRHYADSCFEAWVSGPIDPRLDSINVYARREVVTITEPAERKGRWGLGVFAGYGITAHGLQPCAGISINYNFWNF